MDVTYLYMPGLIIVAVFSLWAILCTKFHDNLIQRIGLSMLCFGASIRIYTAWIDLNDLDGPRLLMVNGLAIYAIGTAWRIWYHLGARPTSRTKTEQ